MVLVKDPFGKIVDAAISLPGNVHNSKSAWWCNIYKHLKALLFPYTCVYDDAFYSPGNMAGKPVKTKDRFIQGITKFSFDRSLTPLH